MTEEPKQITTIDEEGREVNLMLYDIITVDDQEYALLMKDDGDEASKEDSEMVLMRLKKEGEDFVFEVIEDDDEFELVSQAIIDDNSKEE